MVRKKSSSSKARFQNKTERSLLGERSKSHFGLDYKKMFFVEYIKKSPILRNWKQN